MYNIYSVSTTIGRESAVKDEESPFCSIWVIKIYIRGLEQMLSQIVTHKHRLLSDHGRSAGYPCLQLQGCLSG